MMIVIVTNSNNNSVLLFECLLEGSCPLPASTECIHKYARL
jgi:hypothetical protein